MHDHPIKASNDSEASAKPTPKKGFSRLGPAIRHSIAGIVSTFRSESAFRQEIGAFLVLFPLALWLGGSSVERVVLIAPLFLVLVVELLNTALEKAIDRQGMAYNEFAKAAKDAGSAAVFITLLLVLFTWVMVLIVPLAG